MWQLRRVVGASMSPSLMPNQLLIVRPAKSVKKGDVVVVQHDGKDKIKRVAKLNSTKVFVLGDNLAASTDSRTFGWLEKSAITHTVIWPRV